MLQKQIDCLHQEAATDHPDAGMAFLNHLSRLSARMGMRPEVTAAIVFAGLQESLTRGLMAHHGDVSAADADDVLAQAQGFRLPRQLREDHDELVSRLTQMCQSI